MNKVVKYLALNTWAGRRHYKVEVIGETAKRYRVRVLEPKGIGMPSKRFAEFNSVVLVPKYAIIDVAL